jgi:hypothetical protein
MQRPGVQWVQLARPLDRSDFSSRRPPLATATPAARPSSPRGSAGAGATSCRTGRAASRRRGRRRPHTGDGRVRFSGHSRLDRYLFPRHKLKLLRDIWRGVARKGRVCPLDVGAFPGLPGASPCGGAVCDVGVVSSVIRVLRIIEVNFTVMCGVFVGGLLKAYSGRAEPESSAAGALCCSAQGSVAAGQR